MRSLARAVIRLSSWLVPADLRRDWTEQWLGELWALAAGSGVSRRELLAFALGAPQHAIVEALDDWSTHGIVRDVRAAAKRLAREPLFALVCILIVGVAVAANAAIFSAVNATLLRTPPAIGRGDRLVQIGRAKPNGAFDTFSFPVFDDVRQTATAFESTAAYAGDRFVLDEGTGPRLAAGQVVTAEYFRVLRADPSPGRGFTGEEERRGLPVAVIGHDLWRRRFSADAGAIGRTIRVNGVATRIVGVAPAGFVGADIATAAPELWLPIAFDGEDGRARLGDRHLSWVWMIARLHDGASIDQARAELVPVHDAIERAYPRTMGASIAVAPGVGLRPDDRIEARRVMLLMMASVAAVLGIACANVASLLLARSITRRRELAVRLALGASRFRIIRESLVESLLLSLCAGAAGAAVSRWTTAGLRRVMPYELAVGFHPDLTVFAFTLGCAAATGLLLGVLPARRAARTDLMAVIREDVSAKSSGRARAGLLVLQLALSFALVADATVLVRSLVNAQTVSPGFDPDGALTATVSLDRGGWDDERAAAFVEAAHARLAAVPGVVAVGSARRLPVADVLSRRSVSAGDLDLLAAGEAFGAPWNAVDATYFSTMGIRIVRGRAFDGGDRRGSEKVAIVSESLARRLWGDADPIGRPLRAGMDRARVVGVARDSAVGSLRDRTAPAVYAPIAQQRTGAVTLIVRAAPGLAPGSLREPVRAAVEALAPGAPLARVETLRALVAGSLGETRLTATLLALYGAVALVLSSVGLFALQLHATRQRRREFGVRLALGASPHALARAVVAGNLRLTAIGIAAGCVMALLAGRVLERLLFGVSPTDPVSLLAAVALFLACAVAAAAGPARHAAAIDPITSLRHD